MSSVLRTKLALAAALAATAFAGAAVPAQAAGPPQTIDKAVQLTCTLDLGGFVLRELPMFLRVHAVAPSTMAVTDTVFIEDSYAELRIPGATADALPLANGGDTLAGTVDVVRLALTHANPAAVNVTDPLALFGPQPLPGGRQETSVRIPGTGTLPATGPIRASAAAVNGDRIEARLTTVGALLSVTSSTNPELPPATLPLNCVNANADNLVSSIPIVSPPPPVISSMAPTSGPTAGGQTVTITGSNLGGAVVTIDGAHVEESIDPAGTTVRFTTPPHDPGTVTVTVSTAAAVDTRSYTYNAPAPTIAAISPNNGPAAGGTSVTITGTNLAGAVVKVDGADVTASGTTATSVSFVAPAHAAGVVPVAVTTAGGTASTTFIYNAPAPGLKAPTVTKLAPNQAIAQLGGLTIVTGTNLAATSGVKVGGKKAEFVKVNATTIIVVLPALTKGTYDLVVTNATGSSPVSAGSKVKYISLW